jgi:hypothetical protein
VARVDLRPDDLPVPEPEGEGGGIVELDVELPRPDTPQRDHVLAVGAELLERHVERLPRRVEVL